MVLKKLTPIIYTKDLLSTVDFYVNTLGFYHQANTIEMDWASVQLDNVTLMISKPNAHIDFENSMFTGSFYIEVDTIDKVWNDLKDITNICYQIEDFSYGMREFAIYDNNGYVLQFGQKINE